MQKLNAAVLALSFAIAQSLAAESADRHRTAAVDLAAIDEPSAAQIFSESEVAIYFPAAQRIRFLPAADDVTHAAFLADLERDFPSFRSNTFGPWILKQPSVVRPLAIVEDAAVQPSDVQPAAAGVVFSESFESGLSQWKLADSTGGRYTFAASGCGVHSGTWGADAVRNGTAGQYMFCSDVYPKSVTTQITHSSCEAIQGASQAWLDFYFTADMDSSDSLGVYYLASDNSLWGYAFSGNWTGWNHVAFNLKQWNHIGDLTAQSCPKVYFQFNSGTANATHAGPRIDDLTIRTDAPAALRVGVNATPASGPVPLTVNFTPTLYASAGGESYQWSFGDASSSTATTANATFVYTTPGTYWPRLRVIDSAGTRSYAHTQITATTASACSVSCAATVPSTAAAGTAVAFAGTATASSCSSSAAYAWEFGDGSTAAQQNPSHVYAAAGNYSWKFTASAGATTCSKNGTIAISASTTTGRMRAVKPPSSQLLTQRVIGAAGGTLTGGGVTLTVPAGAFSADSTLSLAKAASAAADQGDVSDTFALTGLPQTLGRDLTLEIQLPSNAPSLGTGESYYLSIEAPALLSRKGADTLDAMMPFLLKASVSGMKLSAPITTKWASVKSSPAGAAALAYAPTTPVRVKALKLTVTETDHFTAPALKTRISSTSAILSLLEQHYQKLTSLGFSLSCRNDSTGKFKKIEVSPALLGTGDSDPVGYHVGHDDPCGNNYYFYDYLQITISYPSTDDKVKAGTAHELFHLVQDIYSPGGGRANLWLKEASSTWFETEVVPSACPDVENAYREFAFNGMFNSVKSAVPGFLSSTREQRHGYGAASMLQYRTGTSGIANDPFVRTIWDNVKGGTSELKAFEAALGTTAQDFWRDFARKYYFGTAGGKCQPTWSSFARVSVTDTKTMTQATTMAAYPLSARSWNIDLTKFSATSPVPALITAAGLIDNQSVHVYDVRAKSEIAELTKDNLRFDIGDLTQKSGSVLVCAFVDRNAPSGDVNSQSSTNEVTVAIGSAVSFYGIGVKEVLSCGDPSRDWGTWGGFLAKWSGNSFEYTETSTTTESGVLRANETTIRGTVSADRKVLTSFSYEGHGKETYGTNGVSCPSVCTYEVWKSATLASLPAGPDWSPAALIYQATGSAARNAVTKWSHRILTTGWKAAADNFDCNYPLDETKVGEYTISVYVK